MIDHTLMVYHLAPNTVFLVGSQTITLSQHWPGDTPGDHIVNLLVYFPYVPSGEEEREMVKRSMGGLIDTVATEDFPCLPKMQANFESNRHAEVVFGRNEPALTDRHRYFARAAQGAPPSDHGRAVNVGEWQNSVEGEIVVQPLVAPSWGASSGQARRVQRRSLWRCVGGKIAYLKNRKFPNSLRGEEESMPACGDMAGTHTHL